jgi:hypothetical protein
VWFVEGGYIRIQGGSVFTTSPDTVVRFQYDRARRMWNQIQATGGF